jgi:hypothetical protein
MNDTGRESQFPLHASGVAAKLTVGGTSKAEGIQKFPCPLPTYVFLYTVKRCTEAQVVKTGQLGVKVALIGNDADQVLSSLGITSAIYATDTNPARIGAGQSREHIYSGGLASAVGTQEAKQLAPVYAEGNIIYSQDFAVVFGQPLYLNDSFRVYLMGHAASFLVSPYRVSCRLKYPPTITAYHPAYNLITSVSLYGYINVTGLRNQCCRIATEEEAEFRCCPSGRCHGFVILRGLIL